MLAVHSAAGYEELGLAVIAVDGVPVADGSKIAPDGSEIVASARDPWALDLRGGYGLRIPGNRLLTWTGSLNHSPAGPRFTLGAQIGIGVGSFEAPPETPPVP